VHIEVTFQWKNLNRIGGVMVCELASSAIDREFQSRSDQTKNNKFGICCFFVKHTILRAKSIEWLARTHNVSELSDMSTHRLLFQCASTAKI